MSKRDELMKLKAQRVHKPIHEMESPVEDIPLILENEINNTVDIEQNSSKIIDASEKKQQTQTKEVLEKTTKTVDKTIVQKEKPDTENEKTKRTSMALKVENNQFIRLRSIQLGMSIQYYTNLLIEEEKQRQLEENYDLSIVQENVERNYKRGDNTTIVALVLKESNAKFLKRNGAMLGMNSTTFLNHIISQEERREEQQGKRRSEYDE